MTLSGCEGASCFGTTRLATPDGSAALSFHGELDVASVGRARAALKASHAEHGRVLLVLDDLDFLAVSGLRLLVDVAHEARSTGWLAMTRGSGAVRRLVELAEVADLLPWDDQRCWSLGY